jgi:flagellar biosynthesis/type III secretory pathway M-ring protein FliF/YscJ
MVWWILARRIRKRRRAREQAANKEATKDENEDANAQELGSGDENEDTKGVIDRVKGRVDKVLH